MILNFDGMKSVAFVFVEMKNGNGYLFMALLAGRILQRGLFCDLRGGFCLPKGLYSQLMEWILLSQKAISAHFYCHIARLVV